MQGEGKPKDVTTLLTQRGALSKIFARGATLSVIAGPSRGHSFRVDDLDHRRTLVGSSVACDIILADRRVSRRHAAVETRLGELLLVDLGSSNGTYLGPVRIREAFLKSGDVFTIGETSLRVDLDAEEHPIESDPAARFHGVIGTSREMRRLYPTFRRIAETDLPVLVEGETGTGKEVLADSLHRASRRARGPFVVCDCTTLTPTLLEAELFGWERGAFTGASEARAGLFENAHGGTLFIDEIGELEIGLQAKLLRALERGEVRRVGGSRYTKTDVRVIAATRRDLDQEVTARRFRDDLFYRLAVTRLELPPLRRRSGDVSFLAQCFAKELGGPPGRMPTEMLERLEAHDWPGNVRELKNVIARYVALAELELEVEGPQGEKGCAGGPSTARGPDFLEALLEEGRPLEVARERFLAEFERRYVRRMLERTGGNVTRAAEAAGVGRRYFQKLKARV